MTEQPFISKQAFHRGKWTMRLPWQEEAFDVTVDPDSVCWNEVKDFWQKFNNEALMEIKEAIVAILHYDSSIEWGVDFGYTEEELMGLTKLETVHVARQGCQFIFRCKATGKSPDRNDNPWEIRMVAMVDWQFEIEDVDYVEEDR